MKTLLKLTLVILVFAAISCGRNKDPDELVVSEWIFEENGKYYSGDCELQTKELYTGTGTFYHENGKVKGTYTLKKGLPEGHWEQFNFDGTKKLDLYFDHGKLINKEVN